MDGLLDRMENLELTKAKVKLEAEAEAESSDSQEEYVTSDDGTVWRIDKSGKRTRVPRFYGKLILKGNSPSISVGSSESMDGLADSALGAKLASEKERELEEQRQQQEEYERELERQRELQREREAKIQHERDKELEREKERQKELEKEMDDSSDQGSLYSYSDLIPFSGTSSYGTRPRNYGKRGSLPMQKKATSKPFSKYESGQSSWMSSLNL